MSRYGRQTRLADVGASGQARIEALRAALTTEGFARTIEARYLRAAGASIDAEAAPPAGGASPDLGLRHAAARDVAAGAYAALLTLRRAIAEGE